MLLGCTLRWLIAQCCGEEGSAKVAEALECCDRPNPILQISYIVLILTGYGLYAWQLFALLHNNPWASTYHMYTGTSSMVACLLVFVAACSSDPGTITARNVKQHNVLYGCDGAVWPQKECKTCRLSRPARSKHCRTCDRCVARFDHHCAWINNCVGLGNLRLFLLFLLTNMVMCLYGGLLAVAILGGELKRHGVLDHRYMNWQTGEYVYLAKQPAKLLEWLLVYFPVGVALTVFMFMALILLSVFFGYQLYLISQGKTQYEAFRWIDLHKYLLEEEEERLKQLEALKQSSYLRNNKQSISSDGADHHSRGRIFGIATSLRKCILRTWDCLEWKQRKDCVQVHLPPNPYNHGFARNLAEIIFYEWYIYAAQTSNSKDE
jgi:hypothetical protein